MAILWLGVIAVSVIYRVRVIFQRRAFVSVKMRQSDVGGRENGEA
jgi:hypothetical protein